MTAPGDVLLLVMLAAVLMACCGYGVGRLHQRRHGAPEQKAAYKKGYDAATSSVFGMAARAAGRNVVAPEVVPLGPDVDVDVDVNVDVNVEVEVPAQREGRHAVPDELVRAATYLLPPDRVARAKVPNPRT